MIWITSAFWSSHFASFKRLSIVDRTLTTGGGNEEVGHSLSNREAGRLPNAYDEMTCDDPQVPGRDHTLGSPSNIHLHGVHDNIQRSYLPDRVTALDAFAVDDLEVSALC